MIEKLLKFLGMRFTTTEYEEAMDANVYHNLDDHIRAVEDLKESTVNSHASIDNLRNTLRHVRSNSAFGDLESTMHSVGRRNGNR